MQDRHVNYCEIEAALGIISTNKYKIFHDHLAALLFDKIPKIDSCLKKRNDDPSNDVYKIVTGGEAWIYAHDPESKEQSTAWVFQNEVNPTTLQRSRLKPFLTIGRLLFRLNCSFNNSTLREA